MLKGVYPPESLSPREMGVALQSTRKANKADWNRQFMEYGNGDLMELILT